MPWRYKFSLCGAARTGRAGTNQTDRLQSSFTGRIVRLRQRRWLAQTIALQNRLQA